MNNQNLRIYLLSLMIGCFLFVGCSDNDSTGPGDVNDTSFRAEEEFSFKVDVVDYTQLKLEAVNGSITISGETERDSVIIQGIKQVGSDSFEDAEAHLPLLHVIVQNPRDEVHVRTVQPQQSNGRDYVVDYEILLPANFDVDVVNANGSIVVNSIDNRIYVACGNGEIVLNEIQGSAIVQLGNGTIEAGITLPLYGVINLSTGNGIIDLTIPRNTSADFQAAVGNGAIDIANLTFYNQVITSNSVTGILGEGHGTIMLNTGNGNILVLGI